MAKRKRDVPVLFWVSAEELELIHQKMQQYGTENLSAYLRKMALDGYVVKLELPDRSFRDICRSRKVFLRLFRPGDMSHPYMLCSPYRRTTPRQRGCADCLRRERQA